MGQEDAGRDSPEGAPQLAGRLTGTPDYLRFAGIEPTTTRGSLVVQDDDVGRLLGHLGACGRHGAPSEARKGRANQKTAPNATRNTLPLPSALAFEAGEGHPAP